MRHVNYVSLLILCVWIMKRGSGDPNFFLHISSNWVKLRLPSKNHLPGLPGWSTASKEAESPSWGGGGGGRDPDFFLHISSSWVKLSLPSKNYLPGLSCFCLEL